MGQISGRNEQQESFVDWLGLSSWPSLWQWHTFLESIVYHTKFGDDSLLLVLRTKIFIFQRF
jgi:hypothetical protein